MAKTRTRMSYRKAKAGSSRGISASQWNGLVDMHKNFYNTPAGQRPLPSVLESSTIAMAVMDADHEGETIGAYQPVRIVKSLNFENIHGQSAGFTIMPVDSTYYSDNRHGSYAFTLSEGIQEGGGGRIVIAGLAIAAVPAGEILGDRRDLEFDGTYDSAYYNIADKTLSDLDHPIAPVGHFKIVSPYEPNDIKLNTDDMDVTRWVILDLEQRPSTFMANIPENVPPATGESPSLEYKMGYASPLICTDGTGDLSGTSQTLDMTDIPMSYEINVYNTSRSAVERGEHLITYSREYNRFLIVAVEAGGGGEGGSPVNLVESDSAISLNGSASCSTYSSSGSTPQQDGGSVVVRNDWQLDLGLTIPSGTRMMVQECADGYHRPISIDGSWIARSTYLTQTATQTTVYSQYYNFNWHQFDMNYFRDRGYGLSAFQDTSTVDILRTGVYTLSITWGGYNHGDNTALRITDGSGFVLTSQVLSSSASQYGGNVVFKDFVVTQSMINNGGVQIVFEFCSPDAQPSAGISYLDEATTRVERTGD